MFQGMGGRIFHFGNYITRSATGENVVIQTFKKNNLQTLETIEKFFWQDTIWIGQNVTLKVFGDFKSDREPIKETFEKQFIQHKLSLNEYNVTQTAKAIGVERSYMHKKIKRIMLIKEKA